MELMNIPVWSWNLGNPKKLAGASVLLAIILII